MEHNLEHQGNRQSIEAGADGGEVPQLVLLQLLLSQVREHAAGSKPEQGN